MLSCPLTEETCWLVHAIGGKNEITPLTNYFSKQKRIDRLVESVDSSYYFPERRATVRTRI